MEIWSVYATGLPGQVVLRLVFARRHQPKRPEATESYFNGIGLEVRAGRCRLALMSLQVGWFASLGLASEARMIEPVCQGLAIATRQPVQLLSTFDVLS